MGPPAQGAPPSLFGEGAQLTGLSLPSENEAPGLSGQPLPSEHQRQPLSGQPPPIEGDLPLLSGRPLPPRIRLGFSLGERCPPRIRLQSSLGGRRPLRSDAAFWIGDGHPTMESRSLSSGSHSVTVTHKMPRPLRPEEALAIADGPRYEDWFLKKRVGGDSRGREGTRTDLASAGPSAWRCSP